jgi:hypothetical protein
MLVIPMPEKKVQERHSSLRSSEKEFLEHCSFAFHHKNMPASNHNLISMNIH